MTGTAAHVTPVVELDRRAIGDGKIGPITREIVRIYFDIITGRRAQVPQLVHPVLLKGQGLTVVRPPRATGTLIGAGATALALVLAIALLAQAVDWPVSFPLFLAYVGSGAACGRRGVRVLDVRLLHPALCDGPPGDRIVWGPRRTSSRWTASRTCSRARRAQPDGRRYRLVGISRRRRERGPVRGGAVLLDSPRPGGPRYVRTPASRTRSAPRTRCASSLKPSAPWPRPSRSTCRRCSGSSSPPTRSG